MASIAVPNTTLTLTSTYLGFGLSDDIKAFNEPPLFMQDNSLWLRLMAPIVKNAMKGKTNNTGRATLTPNSATTTVSLRAGLLGKDTLVILLPLTAAAATEFAAGSLYVSNTDVANAQFTITHVNSATIGRKFGYILIG